MPRKPRFRSFDEAFDWLASRTNYETMATQRYDARTYGLDRVRRLLADAGRPDLAYDVAQVVGSKGKGSTATALAEILRASGRRVGLFTSPHLIDPRERVRVDGRPAADRLVRDALSSLVPLADAAAARGEPLTFFEIHTVAALLTFRAAKCDAVVLEAGMGGRLDATTAAESVCKVLTSVSLDHTRQLGRTRAAIAREKAAVATKDVPLVSGEPVDSDVGQIIAEICADAGAPLFAIGREFDVDNVETAFDARTGRSSTTFRLVDPRRTRDFVGATLASPWRGRRNRQIAPQGEASLAPTQDRDSSPDSLTVPLLGAHQATNAALAAVAALTARWRDSPITLDHVRCGLSRTKIRARLETLSLRPITVVDGAHNPTSVALLAKTVRDVVPGRPRVFVVGMAADKDVRGSLRRLRGTADLVIATSSGQARALAARDLAAMAREVGLRSIARPTPQAAVDEARRRAGTDGLVVVTGSLYLCGESLRL